MTSRFSFCLILFLVFGLTASKKWWKYVLEDTNAVVHDIANLNESPNCTMPMCSGFEISLCGSAGDYQNVTQGVYWMDGYSNGANTYYNFENSLYIFNDSCKLITLLVGHSLF